MQAAGDAGPGPGPHDVGLHQQHRRRPHRVQLRDSGIELDPVVAHRGGDDSSRPAPAAGAGPTGPAERGRPLAALVGGEGESAGQEGNAPPKQGEPALTQRAAGGDGPVVAEVGGASGLGQAAELAEGEGAGDEVDPGLGHDLQVAQLETGGEGPFGDVEGIGGPAGRGQHRCHPHGCRHAGPRRRCRRLDHRPPPADDGVDVAEQSLDGHGLGLQLVPPRPWCHPLGGRPQGGEGVVAAVEAPDQRHRALDRHERGLLVGGGLSLQVPQQDVRLVVSALHFEHLGQEESGIEAAAGHHRGAAESAGEVEVRGEEGPASRRQHQLGIDVAAAVEAPDRDLHEIIGVGQDPVGGVGEASAEGHPRDRRHGPAQDVPVQRVGEADAASPVVVVQRKQASPGEALE